SAGAAASGARNTGSIIGTGIAGRSGTPTFGSCALVLSRRSRTRKSSRSSSSSARPLSRINAINSRNSSRLTEAFAAGCSSFSLRAAICFQPDHKLGRLVGFLGGVGGFALGCFLRTLLLRSCGFRPLLRGFGCFDFAGIVYQLDNRELRVVAVTMAELENARVAAGPVLVTLSQLVEETLERSHAGGTLR